MEVGCKDFKGIAINIIPIKAGLYLNLSLFTTQEMDLRNAWSSLGKYFTLQ